MADFLITPIEVSGLDGYSHTDPEQNPFIVTPSFKKGVKKCCDNGIVIGEPFNGAKYDVNDNSWTLFQTPTSGSSGIDENAQTDDLYVGAITFGICCATGVRVNLTGQIEMLDYGFDWASVAVNGIQKWEKRSLDKTPDDTLEDRFKNEIVSATLELPLDPRPCGNIISIIASTQDRSANNDIYWKASIEII